MKKKLFLLASVVFAACGVLSACAEEKHTHDYAASVTPPTCIEGGYTTYTCSCGDSYIADETAKISHNYSITETKEPTCAEKGYTAHKCDMCGDFYIDGYVAAKGHTFGETGEKTSPACTTSGYTTYSCSVCGMEKTTDYVKAAGHEFVNNVCTHCGETEFTFTLNADGESYTVGKGTANLLSANIPEAYDGKPVTAVSGSGFYYSNLLESVEIPDSVKTIGNAAFFKCPALKSVTIGGGITGIGDRAFFDCGAINTVMYNAAECSDLDADNEIFYKAGADGSGIELTVGAHVKKIPANLFRTDDTAATANLKSVAFAANAECESIGAYAFYNAVTLEDATIPEEITEIGSAAFYNTESLKNLAFNAKRCCAFGSNNDLFYGAGLGGDGISVTIGKSVEYLSDYQFYSATSPKITKVTFESGSVLEKLGKYSFGYCKYLTDIAVPESVTEISEAAFGGCSSLVSMTLPFVGGSVKTASDAHQYPLGYIFGETNYEGSESRGQQFIDDGGPTTKFYYIPRTLRQVTILGGNILYGAFYNFRNLTDITVPENIPSIGAYAFYECRALKSITIPKTVGSIGEYAYYNCISVTSLRYEATACEDLVAEVYGGVNSATRNNSFTYVGSQGGGVDMLVTKNVTHIPNNLFYPYQNAPKETAPAIKKLIFEEGSACLSVGISAFRYCDDLVDVVLGEGITEISDYAFYSCSALESIALPEALETLGVSAFQNCSLLSEITVGGNIKAIRASAIGSTELYENPENWEGGALYIGDYLIKGDPNVTACEIKAGTALIADNAFYNCYSLRTVTIPSTVYSIGAEAFENCSALQSISIPHSVTFIGTKAFMACNHLTDIYYNANCGNFEISDNVFSDSGTGSTTVTIGKDVESVPAYLFYSCSKITKLKFERGGVCTSVNTNSFFRAGLTVLYIPENLTTMGIASFGECTLLEYVYCEGTEAEWTALLDGAGEANKSTFGNSATHVYYYSATAQSGGNFWYYGDNGEAKIWGRG